MATFDGSTLLSTTGFGATSPILPRPGLEVALVVETSLVSSEAIGGLVEKAQALPRPFQRVLDVAPDESGLQVTLERFCGVDLARVTRELRQADRALPLDVWLAMAELWIRAVEAIPSSHATIANTPWRAHQFGVELTGAVTLSIDQHNHVLGHSSENTERGVAVMPRAREPGRLPYSLSPEHVRGVARLPSSRVHTMGSLLISLLTFERPFGAPSEFQLLQNVIEGRAKWTSTLHPQCTPQLREVLDRAIALDPKQRWPSLEDFRRAIHDAVKLTPADPRRLAGVVFGANPAGLRELVANLEARPEFLPPSWASGGLRVLEDQLLEQLVPLDELPVLGRVAASQVEAPPRINLAGGRRVPISAPRVNLAPAAPWWRRLLGLRD